MSTPKQFDKYSPVNGHVLVSISGAAENKTQGGIFIPDGVKDTGKFFLLGKVEKVSEDCPEQFKKEDLYVAVRTFGDTQFMSNNGIDQIKETDENGDIRVINLISQHYSQFTTLIDGDSIEIEKGRPNKVIKPDTPKIHRING